jgi:hypothetical protein
MKLSKTTIEVLKNFANINPNLMIKQGNRLATITAHKNVMSSVTIGETFPTDFGVYDLNEFLGVVSLFEDPDFTFSASNVIIKQDKNSVKFGAADASVLVSPTKEIVFPESDVDFNITAAQLSMIQRTSSVLRGADLAIRGDGSKITATVHDKKNSALNSYSLDLGTTDKSFNIFLKVENLKMLPGDYAFSASKKKISRFQAVGTDLVYYVAVEADTTFDF